MANLSTTDKNNLSADQQAQVAELKKQWAAANAAADAAKAAGDKAGMDSARQEMESAHQQAEAIRNSAGYTGGSSGNDYRKVAVTQGGETADQVRQWAEDYTATNYVPSKGWVNGYSTAMNSRSKANYIRQQMDANSKAWHTASDADKEYLHQQNVELAKVLADATGQSEKNYHYDPQTGKWWTWNTNVGYGSDLQWTQPNIAEGLKEFYGYTDADRQKWDADTSRYYNFVDTRAANRNAMDESSGFTGRYSQFVNGPNPSLMHWGSRHVNPKQYSDTFNDGWGLGENGFGGDIRYDTNGNIIPITPVVRDSGLTDYTRKFAAYDLNGVIQPNLLQFTHVSADRKDKEWASKRNGAYSGVDPDSDYVYANQFAGKGNDREPVPTVSGKSYGDDKALAYAKGRSSGSSGNSYIEQMYDALLQSQLEALRASYEQNVSDLDASAQKVNSAYTEQKRQADGQAAQDAANWREMASAYGLNSGAIGQASLAMNNQAQSDLNALNSALAMEQAELERQRVLLGQQYQIQINQAIAENNYQKANALYQEAVRQEELLLQQQKQLASMASAYAKENAKTATGKNSGGSTGTGATGGGGIPALGSEAWYQYVREKAGENGTTMNSYIDANYKSLGIPYRELSDYKTQANDWDDQHSITEAGFQALMNELGRAYMGGATTRANDLLKQYGNMLSSEQYMRLYNQLSR